MCILFGGFNPAATSGFVTDLLEGRVFSGWSLSCTLSPAMSTPGSSWPTCGRCSGPVAVHIFHSFSGRLAMDIWRLWTLNSIYVGDRWKHIGRFGYAGRCSQMAPRCFVDFGSGTACIWNFGSVSREWFLPLDLSGRIWYSSPCWSRWSSRPCRVSCYAAVLHWKGQAFSVSQWKGSFEKGFVLNASQFPCFLCLFPSGHWNCSRNKKNLEMGECVVLKILQKSGFSRIPLETSLLWSILVLLAIFTRASFGISTNSLFFILKMLCLVLLWRLAPEAQANSSSVGRSRWRRWPGQARWPRWPRCQWSWIRGLQSMKCWVSGLRYERQKIKVYLDVHKAPYGM